ncbi:MAG: c-type cytochrome domain-containing protein, partial [Pirellulales bacterium]
MMQAVEQALQYPDSGPMHGVLAQFAIAVLIAGLGAPAISGEIDYEREVRPLLAEKCGSCHGVLKQEAGLRLDAGGLIRAGGDSGPAIAATLHDSLLWQRVTAANDDERMPPADEGTPLNDKQLDVL